LVLSDLLSFAARRKVGAAEALAQTAHAANVRAKLPALGTKRVATESSDAWRREFDAETDGNGFRGERVQDYGDQDGEKSGSKTSAKFVFVQFAPRGHSDNQAKAPLIRDIV
jgi:hypothetical protein